MSLRTRTQGRSRLGAAALVTTVVALACGDKKGQESVSVSIAPSAAAACEPGTHAAGGADGCVPDEAPDDSASAAASAPPKPEDPRCPSLTNPDRLASFDWSSAFGLEAPQAARARGTTGAAAETRLFAAEVEAELRNACARLSRDLGGPGTFASAEAACLGANEAMRAARAKLEAARVNVAIRPPQCYAPSKSFDDCMKACDPKAGLPAGEAVCAKGPIAGKCSGACEGSCTGLVAGRCPGTCRGGCEGVLAGTCDGTCTGKCDGKDMTGAKAGTCKGKCEGRCSGPARGECKGKCEGSCATRTETCPGLCVGRCAKPWDEVACGAGFGDTKAEAQCEAFCTTRADRKATCSTAQVDVKVDKPKDEAAAKRFASALERNLPAIVRLSEGMKGRLAAASTRNEKAVSEGVKALTGEAEPKATAGFGACMGPVFRAVADGSASLRSNLKAAELIESGARGRLVEGRAGGVRRAARGAGGAGGVRRAARGAGGAGGVGARPAARRGPAGLVRWRGAGARARPARAFAPAAGGPVDGVGAGGGGAKGLTRGGV